LGPKPGLARSFYIVIKNIEIDQEIYHRNSETLTGATGIATNKEFIHLRVSFYPSNNAKKLKKVTEKITNYPNPASVFIQFSYNFPVIF